MQQSQIQIATLQHKAELVHQLQEQAFETEQKQLDNALVNKSIEFVLGNPDYGFFFIYLEQQHIFGQILMTKEYNVYTGLTCWFQSVYVKKDHRQRGIFKSMFNEFLKYAKSQKAPTKLYVEVENKIAIKAYEKLGMIRTEEVIFEDDFVFHPIKIINLGMDCHTRASTNKKEIEDFIKKGKSVLENDKSMELQIEMCLNKNKNPFLITQNQTDFLIGLYFIEFSDWRNGLIIWFYDFISSTYNNGMISIMISNMLTSVKQKLIKFNPDLKGIRILVDRSKGSRLEQLLEVVGLKESHYHIYYKASN